MHRVNSVVIAWSAVTKLQSDYSVADMSDVTTETQTTKKFDPEAFAMNVARAMENGGQALAAYLKSRESGGEAKDKPPNELAEMVKTFTSVAEYWMSDQARATELQTKMGKTYLDLWA